MLIGELVQKSGLPKDTIRFYEKKGLITLGRKERRDNNYKEYSESVLNKLLLIRRLKDLGFTLAEIDTFFEGWQADDASCISLKPTLENKIAFVEEQLQRLRDLKTMLTASLARCNNDDCEFEKAVSSCIGK